MTNLLNYPSVSQLSLRSMLLFYLHFRFNHLHHPPPISLSPLYDCTCPCRHFLCKRFYPHFSSSLLSLRDGWRQQESSYGYWFLLSFSFALPSRSKLLVPGQIDPRLHYFVRVYLPKRVHKGMYHRLTHKVSFLSQNICVLIHMVML